MKTRKRILRSRRQQTRHRRSQTKKQQGRRNKRNGRHTKQNGGTGATCTQYRSADVPNTLLHKGSLEGNGLLAVLSSMVHKVSKGVGGVVDRLENAVHGFVERVENVVDRVGNRLTASVEDFIEPRLHERIKLWMKDTDGGNEDGVSDEKDFWLRLQNGTIEKIDTEFNLNGRDGIVATAIMIYYYGITSPEYKNFKKHLMKTTRKDIGWIEIPILNMLSKQRSFTLPVTPYREETSDPNCYRLARNQMKIVIISDWATGTPSAINLAKEIGKLNPDYVIHLGDVYYAGTKEEYDAHFIQPLQTHVPSAQIRFIPGNHDYYSGSRGVQHGLSAIGQNATYFSLYNDYIQIEAGDTGYADSNAFSAFVPDYKNIAMPEAESFWHTHRLNVAKENHRKIIMLTHHPLFSHNHETTGFTPDKKTCPLNLELFRQLKPFINDIQLWLWGHIHWFDVYEPYTHEGLTLQRGRTVGNGACESQTEEERGTAPVVFQEHSIPVPVSRCEHNKGTDALPQYPGTFDSIINNSFCVMDLDNDKVTMKYFEIPQSAGFTFCSPSLLFEEEF